MAQKCRVRVISKTHNPADSDGRSCKGVIDGIIEAGILPDDSPEYISETSQSEEAVKKSEPEETTIDIIWDDSPPPQM